MNILISCNDKYIFPTLVMLLSLFINNKNVNIHIFVLYSDLNDENIGIIKKMILRHNGEVTFLLVSQDCFEGFPLEAITNKYITIETYYRLLIERIIPNNIERILYLDVDIIINGSLEELYSYQFKSNEIIAACQDMGVVLNKKIHKLIYSNLNFNKDYKYFNAGVILYNLSKYRDYINFETINRFVCENSDKLAFHDQDILNFHLKYHVAYFDYNIWNCRPFCYLHTKKNDKWIETIPIIIHYGEKPWDRKFSDIGEAVFWKYGKMVSEEEFQKYSDKNILFKKNNVAKIIINRLKRNIKLFLYGKRDELF